MEAWLYKFVFSASQQYVLVFGSHTLRFIRNPGGVPPHPNASNAGFILEISGSEYIIGTPYAAAELPDLKFAQSADILQITHPNHPRMVLRRLGETNWTLSEPVIGATILSPSNQSATITGLPADLHDPQNTTYLYTVTAVNRNGDESPMAFGYGPTLSLFAMVTGINMANTPGTVTLKWDIVAGAAYYNVYKTIPGYANQVPPHTASFGFCGISYGNLFIDSNIVPDFTKSPPLHTDPFSANQLREIIVTASSADWPVGFTDVYVDDPTGTGAAVLAVLNTSTRGALGSIVNVFILSPGQGYTSPTLLPEGGGGTTITATITVGGSDENPTSVAYNQQRLVCAGTGSFPTGIFASKTGFYDNFNRSNPVLDDDAFTFVLAANEINTILHMIPMPGGLVLFTNSGIQQLTGGSTSAQNPSAITPSSAVAVPQSYIGASRVRPVVVGQDILYVQDPGTAVQDLAYNLFTAIYAGADISALSTHLFYPHTIVQWDYQHTPNKVLWAVRDDGVLLSLTFLKEQEVAAWAHHHTDGAFESVAVIREANADAVYVSVNRSGVRYIERLTSRVYNTIADAWCVNAGLAYQGIPTTVLTGLEHLAGRSVAVLGDGVPLGQFTVSGGGSVALPTPVSQAVAGLPYSAKLQTMQLNLGNEMQTVQGKRKRVAAASIRVRNTAGIKVGTTFGTLTPFVPNVSSTDRMDLAGLVTGDMRLIINPSYNVHGQICVQQDNPLPVTVLGIIPEIVVGDTGR